MLLFIWLGTHARPTCASVHAPLSHAHLCTYASPHSPAPGATPVSPTCRVCCTPVRKSCGVHSNGCRTYRPCWITCRAARGGLSVSAPVAANLGGGEPHALPARRHSGEDKPGRATWCAASSPNTVCRIQGQGGRGWGGEGGLSGGSLGRFQPFCHCGVSGERRGQHSSTRGGERGGGRAGNVAQLNDRSNQPGYK